VTTSLTRTTHGRVSYVALWHTPSHNSTFLPQQPPIE
jgi:hypothetical protein